MKYAVLKISSIVLIVSLSACSFQNSRNPDPTISYVSTTPTSQTHQRITNQQVISSSSTNPTAQTVDAILNSTSLADLSRSSRAEDSVQYKNEIANAVAQNYNEEFRWQNESPVSLQTAMSNRLSNVKDFKKVCTDHECVLHLKGFFDGTDTRVTQHADKFLITWYTNLDNGDNFAHTKTFLAEFSSLNSLQTMSNTVYSLNGAWVPTDEHPGLDLLKLSEIHDYGPQGGHQCVSAGCTFKAILIKQNNIIAKAYDIELAMNRYGGGSKCHIIEKAAVLLCKSQPYGGTPEEIHSVTSLK